MVGSGAQSFEQGDTVDAQAEDVEGVVGGGLGRAQRRQFGMGVGREVHRQVEHVTE